MVVHRRLRKMEKLRQSRQGTKALWESAEQVLTEECNWNAQLYLYLSQLQAPQRRAWLYLFLFQRRQWHPTPVLLPGKSHGRRSLVGCSPLGREETDTIERLHFHFSFSCIGEGNGNPLQCFCLENPRDGGAWWAAVYGVAQSRTRLRQLSSSSSSSSSLLLMQLRALNNEATSQHKKQTAKILHSWARKSYMYKFQIQEVLWSKCLHHLQIYMSKCCWTEMKT